MPRAAIAVTPGSVKEENETNHFSFSKTSVFWKNGVAALCFITSKISASVTLCRYLVAKSHLLSLVNSLISVLDREMLLVGCSDTTDAV